MSSAPGVHSTGALSGMSHSSALGGATRSTTGACSGWGGTGEMAAPGPPRPAAEASLSVVTGDQAPEISPGSGHPGSTIVSSGIRLEGGGEAGRDTGGAERPRPRTFAHPFTARGARGDSAEGREDFVRAPLEGCDRSNRTPWGQMPEPRETIDDQMVADWSAVGLCRLEAYLARHAAFRDLLSRLPDEAPDAPEAS